MKLKSIEFDLLKTLVVFSTNHDLVLEAKLGTPGRPYVSFPTSYDLVGLRWYIWAHSPIFSGSSHPILLLEGS